MTRFRIALAGLFAGLMLLGASLVAPAQADPPPINVPPDGSIASIQVKAPQELGGSCGSLQAGAVITSVAGTTGTGCQP